MISKHLHMLAIVIIGFAVAGFGLVTAQERRANLRPPLLAEPPPAVKRLCQADGLYLAHELALPIGQVRAQGCEQISLEHIENGFYLVAGVRTDVGE